MKKKQEYVSVKILKEDFRKVKVWAAQRGMKFYEIISLLIGKKHEDI